MLSTGPDRHFRAGQFRRVLQPAAAALLLLALGALAAPARAEPPMWVVKDKDSTIYLFGTVHLMDPSIPWRTSRVDKALAEAGQLWVEVNVPPDGQLALAMSMMQRAMSSGPPLSSRLTDKENARLRELLARSKDGAALGMVIDRMRPWFALVTLGVQPLMSAGYDPEAGVDSVLMDLARKQGDEVRGLETIEQQLEFIAGGTDEEQLAALKELLAVPDAEFMAGTRTMDEGVRAWMKGDTKPLTAYIDSWREGNDPGSAGMSYEQLIVRRNEDWAGQLEKLLQGEGVAFVAVGSGHLVGPDSLLSKLAARGIKVSPH
jgi:uncharacterized protein YbaP (TraB family)